MDRGTRGANYRKQSGSAKHKRVGGMKTAYTPKQTRRWKKKVNSKLAKTRRSFL